MEYLKSFKPLSAAEEKLVECLISGSRTMLGGGEIPDDPNDDVTIRAGLIRHVLTGGDAGFRIHPSGIRLRGAWIAGRLDLQGCNVDVDLTMSKSHFEKAPNLVNARLRGLHLSGCDLPGLIADQARFTGPLFIRSGCIFRGEISLPSASIDGDFQLCDTVIDVETGSALFANGISVSGSVFFGNYPFSPNDTALIASAPILMTSSRIGHDFYISNASLTGPKVEDHNKQADGSETLSEIAFSMSRSIIEGLFFAKALRVSGGIVNLSGVRAKRLNDEPAAEDATFLMRLDGFEYRSFAQHTDISVKSRLRWLARRPVDVGFSAQPYEHLAKLYEQLGHLDDADRVRIAKEDLQRSDDIAIQEGRRAYFRVALLAFSKFTLKYLVGYGYRPIYALLWMVFLIFLLGAFFQKTWNVGDMTPNSAPILVSADWKSATMSHPNNPAEFWSSPGQAGQDYETFYAFAYSADLLIPIVNFGQEDAWAPSTSRSWWGQQGWWMRWFAKALGWVFTALGAAAVTGVIRR